MPVPKAKQKQYGATVASIIKSKKKQGVSGSEALVEAKAIADEVLLKHASRKTQ